MKSNTHNFACLPACFALILFLTLTAFSQQYFLNEIEIDPPAVGNDACQYIEIKGPAGATVPTGTYFLSLNSDAGNFGFANQAVNIGGLVVGANGTITLHNNFSGACPNRTYPLQTTLFEYNSPLFIGGGSETYLVVQSSTAISTGQDLDTDDDGNFNFAITVLDGFALLINPKEEFVYGSSTGVVNISNTTSTDQPDAVTRFRSNTTPFVPAAFYFGELAGTPGETPDYADPRSPNFPSGGILTPGAQNAPVVDQPVRSPFDFDGDGKTDISIFRPSSGEWWINRSGTSNTIVHQFGSSSDEVIPADFTGDGRSDVAIWRPSTGEWFILRSEDLTYFSFPFGTNGDVPVPADYDADGKADSAIYRPATSTWFINRSTNGQTTIQNFGAAGDIPVPADYDGDDRSDLAIFRPSNGQWWMNRSTAGVIALAFGNSSDKLVQGDYTGDGKADVALWRPSNGEWFILRSEDFSFYSAPFGSTNDIPVAGDYDGDGKFDISVFRPSSATWFSQRSTAGTIIQQFGVGTDVPLPSVFVP